MIDGQAEAALDRFIDRYTPEIAALTRDVIARMRDRLPGAVQLVYDNYNALAIAFGPTDRTSEAIFSVAVFPCWVSLFFMKAASLSDRTGFLKGRGRHARHIVLDRADRLDDDAVRQLMDEALAASPRPIDPARPPPLIIRSISEKQRPRRPLDQIADRNQLPVREAGTHQKMMMTGRLALTVACLSLAACGIGVSSTESLPILRQATDTPPRFVLDPASATAQDTIPGEGCRSPLHDPRDRTAIVMVRSAAGRGDYQTPAGRYGIREGELLRVSCNTGAPLGVVRR